jgi:hypothetical protein
MAVSNMIDDVVKIIGSKNTKYTLIESQIMTVDEMGVNIA